MRRKRKNKREIIPDPVYGSTLVSKFTNQIMQGGKKATAQKVMWGALEVIKKTKKEEDPVTILENAIKNVSPTVEVRPRRVGGATYQVPHEVRPERKLALALRWLTAAARGKKGKPMAEKLAEEILLAYKNEGSAIKKKLDTHRMAEANRAFAHFAW
ncbi:30S ribosomal protein S7 [Candidatus Giovannonibacteria bacterium]|nr:30S ribosomal protein S7 [Candidatus Giovannonibacteria bacterium]